MLRKLIFLRDTAMLLGSCEARISISSVTLEVLPLSFREYLAFRGIELQQHDAHSESVARAALEQYLQWGGFPEVVLATPAMRPLILEEYASLMFWRDLVERHSIRNEPVMRSLLRHCAVTRSVRSGSWRRMIGAAHRTHGV